MERYYKILGITSNATKQEIKQAYHKKIKALHPDKTHGTVLEDTATFLSAEINEAYNNLMKLSHNGNTSKSSGVQKCFEEDIYIENHGVLKYSLSNDFSQIQNAMLRRTGNDDISFVYNYGWQLNFGLSKNVKNAMNKYDVNYSMTYYSDGQYKILIVNKREGNDWFIAGYEQEIRPKPEKKQSYNYSGTSNKHYNSSYNSSSKYTSTSTGGHPVRNFFIVVAIIVSVIYFFSQGTTGQPNRTSSTSRTQTTRTTPVYATIRNADWLNVRSSPSSVNNSNIVTQLRRGTRVEVLEQNSNSWVRIRYDNNRIGYVYGYYLTGNTTAPQPASSTTQRATASSTNSIRRIESTLNIVADNLRRGVDVNGDGLVNCIDAAVLFYQHYPVRNEVRIIVNRNSAVDFHHLFNAVLVNGQWRTIEPQAYYSRHSSFWMPDVWGRKYDNSLNRVVTNDYLRFVRN